MYELTRIFQSVLFIVLSVFFLEFLGFIASLLCLSLAGAYAFLAMRGQV